MSNPHQQIHPSNNINMESAPATPCVAPQSAASPYMASACYRQQQNLTINTKAQEKQDIIICLQERAKWTFETLDKLPLVPETVQDQLYFYFRESRDAKDFTNKVEKACVPLLPAGFKLDPEAREQFERIPGSLALDYIIDLRMESDRLEKKRGAPGWLSIANTLKDALGFPYTKGSCQKYFDDWLITQTNHGLQQGDRGRLMVQTPTHARRPHSPYDDGPSKTPRRSVSQSSPGRCSTIPDHATTTASENTATVTNAPPDTSSNAVLQNLLSPTQLVRLLKDSLAQREKLEEENHALAVRALPQEDYSRDLTRRDVETVQLKSENATLHSAISQLDTQIAEHTSHVGRVELDNANKDVLIDRLRREKNNANLKNQNISSELDVEKAAKSKLQSDLNVIMEEKNKLFRELTACQAQLDARTIQPHQLDLAESYSSSGSMLDGTDHANEYADPTINLANSPFWPSGDESTFDSQIPNSTSADFQQFQASGIRRRSGFWGGAGHSYHD